LDVKYSENRKAFLNTKIFYTIDEVSTITKLPQNLIRHYIRVLKKTIAPEHYPDINPRQVKGEYLFTRKDIDEILRFIDKRKDETWEKWQLRVIKETMAKRELDKEKRPPRRPDFTIIKGKKTDKENP
jgi:DNA-binding transcriptional MerR regulator